MNEHELLLKYYYLQNLYRKRNFKNIADEVINDIHINDYKIFPKNWMKIDDIEYKIHLIEEALKNDVPIDNLPEMKINDMIELNDKMRSIYSRK